MRYLPHDDYVALDRAQARLGRYCGGPAKVETITGIDAERYSTGPVDVRAVAELEMSCNRPVITETLAELSGCRLVPTAGPVNAQELQAALNRLQQDAVAIVTAAAQLITDRRVSAGDMQEAAETAANTIDILAQHRRHIEIAYHGKD